MTNKIKKFLYTLEHLNRDAHEEIQTFAFYRPLLYYVLRILIDNFSRLKPLLFGCKRFQYFSITSIFGLFRTSADHFPTPLMASEQ